MATSRGPFITTAAFCETLLTEASGVLTLVRIVDRITHTAVGPNPPEEMPTFSVDWTLVITLKSGDVRGSHPVKITPELPSGETRDPVILSAHFEGGSKGVNLVSQIGMLLSMPGIYWFHIHVNDELMTKVPLEVIYSRIVTPGNQD